MSASSDLGVLLARSFRALRDLFIYLLPGGTFLALLCCAMAEHGEAWAWPDQLPGWLGAALVLGACYIAGTFLTILAHIATSALYPPHGLSRGQAVAQQVGAAPRTPERVTEDLRLRHHFPGLFEESDRLRLIADFRLSLAMALLLGGLILATHARDEHGGVHGILAMLGGALLFLNARSGFAVAQAELEATRRAALNLPQPPPGKAD